MLQVPDKLLEIRNASGHLVGTTFNGDNLNSCVDMAELVENRHLGADVIDHEGIFAELHLNTELLPRRYLHRRNLDVNPCATRVLALSPRACQRKLQLKPEYRFPRQRLPTLGLIDSFSFNTYFPVIRLCHPYTSTYSKNVHNSLRPLVRKVGRFTCRTKRERLVSFDTIVNLEIAVGVAK
jgi:hypothetical protein